MIKSFHFGPLHLDLFTLVQKCAKLFLVLDFQVNTIFGQRTTYWEKRIQIFANFWIGIIFIVQKKNQNNIHEKYCDLHYICVHILFQRKVSYLNVILKKKEKYYTVKLFKERRVIEKTKYLLKSPQKGRMKKNLYFMNVNV